MRKYFVIILAIALIFVLVFATGCSGSNDAEETYNSDWQGAIEQSQGAQITGVVDNQVMATYSEGSEMDDFVSALQIDQWAESELPEGDKFQYNVTFFNINDNGQSIVAVIKTYEDSNVIVLESLGSKWGFEIPEEAIETINNAQ